MLETKFEQNAATSAESGLQDHSLGGKNGANLGDMRRLSGTVATNGPDVLDFSPNIYKIADNYVPAKPFQLEAKQYDVQTNQTEFTDSQGVNPFGLKASVYDASATKSNGYYSAVIGMQGHIGGTDNGARDVINVNINDALKVDGQNVSDGHTHRHVFKIAQHGNVDSHWQWIDASVGVDSRGNAVLHVFRISPSKEKPAQDNEWDKVDRQYKLAHLKEPLQASPDDYWSLITGTYTKRNLPNWYNFQYLEQVNETAKETY